MAKNPTLQARVLVDNASLGIQCGHIVEGPDKVIKALAAAGAVDCHPDAVAYASAQGVNVAVLEDKSAQALLA